MKPAYRYIRARLALMMFLQYSVMGALWPVLSLYLKQCLGYSGAQTGMVLSLSAAAAFVAPAVGACVADRLVSAERLLSLCHFGAALFLSLIVTQSRFETVLALYLGYALCMGPTVPLTNAITFHHAPDGHHRFGNTRVWGTLAWVTVAWTFGYLWLAGLGEGSAASRLPDALRLSASASLLLGLYGLTLPRVDKRIEGPIRIIPRESLRVLAHPQVMLIAVVGILGGSFGRIYYFGTALYLKDLGYAEGQIMPIMSVGQIAEIVAMCLLAGMLNRFGAKRTILFGLMAETARFAIFAFGSSTPWMVVGNGCHGLAYTFFFTSLYITLDRHCDKASRTGLHQLFTLGSAGLGGLLANLGGGWCLDHFVRGSERSDYRAFWLVPTVAACICFILIALWFREDYDRNQIQEIPRTGE